MKKLKVRIGDLREGPSPLVQAALDLPLAARAAETLAKLVIQIKEKPDAKAWSGALAETLWGNHEAMTAWREAMGPESSTKLMVETNQLLWWARGDRAGPDPTPYLVNKLKASVLKLKKNERVEVAERRQKWAAEAVAKGGKIGHRWTNQPNTIPRRQTMTEDGSVSILDAVVEQTGKWSEKWSVHDLKAILAFEAEVRKPSSGEPTTRRSSRKRRQVGGRNFAQLPSQRRSRGSARTRPSALTTWSFRP